MTKAFFVDTKNRFYLMLYDIINYNDISTADSVKYVCFTDV